MALSRVKLIHLFEKATNQNLQDPDILLNLEIVDRMNQSSKVCLEGIDHFKQLFKQKELQTVRLAVLLFETCIKNCKQHFHQLVHDKGVFELLLHFLKRKRNKLSIIEKMSLTFKDEGWRQVEERIL